jgi:hypothetical protein
VEMAAKCKQKHNLDIPGISSNEFVILNNLDNEFLAQTAKDLDIHLSSDEEGVRKQISVVKAEKILRANLVEAEYRDHLEKLKHEECIPETKVLDLTVFDNNGREGVDPNATEKETQKENKKKKKMRFMFWNIRCFGRPARRNIIRDYISSEGMDGIGLQETMKGDFTQRELDDISRG